MDSDIKIRANIRVHGIVQGVGFRPFIHKQIISYSLCGWIRNTSFGAEIEIEGTPDFVNNFIDELPVKAPKLAVIEKVEPEFFEDLKGYTDFKIIESKSLDSHDTLISPDICICDDCLREMRDPENPRYMYPFINCTNCGPRFTIIKDIPYDRDKTTMAPFKMCDSCHAEYTDINDRRYHAQPDCCPECGPELVLLDNNGSLILGNCKPDNIFSEKDKSECEENYVAETIQWCYRKDEDSNENQLAYEIAGSQRGIKTENNKNEINVKAIRLAQKYLAEGKIIAVKGLGGMHLACRYDVPEIAKNLRRRKQRDEKPFALMMRDAEAAKKLCHVSKDEEKILTGFRRPIVLLKKKDRNSYKYLSENNYIGVMLPYTPLHYILFEGAPFDGLIMTSANLSDLPIMYKNEEAVEKLQGIADAFLLHNREIETRCDDSLMWVVDGEEYPVRRSRGYVPFPVKINKFCKLSEDSDNIKNSSIQSAGIYKTDKLSDTIMGSSQSSGMELNAACEKSIFKNNLLACGAEQKATFALAKENYVFPSQHIGDLKNIETLENYEKQIKHFERMFSIKPEIIVCDLHPDYLSTEYAVNRAENEGLKLIQVQHHHAHMASCMADNNLNEPCIGIIWDGTGLGGTDNGNNFRDNNGQDHGNGENILSDGGSGYQESLSLSQGKKSETVTDGTIWGGEFLVGDYSGFKRLATIKPFRLPGGDKAAKEIWRCGVALLCESWTDSETVSKQFEILKSACYGKEQTLNENNCLIKGKIIGGDSHNDSTGNSAEFSNNLKTVEQMLKNNINCPTCTSMGRLFDGVASLLGIKQEASYEGQGAILLEAAACDDEDGILPYEITESDKYYFDYTKTIASLLDKILKYTDCNICIDAESCSDKNKNLNVSFQSHMAAMFMNTIVEMAVDISKLIRKDTGLNKIVLSGGTFQNQYMLKRLLARLKAEGFEAYNHHRVSTNDEGIALGQIMVANSLSNLVYQHSNHLNTTLI